jgi:hypothetical protein
MQACELDACGSVLRIVTACCKNYYKNVRFVMNADEMLFVFQE